MPDQLSHCQTAVLNRARKSRGDLDAVHSGQIAERNHALGVPTSGRWSIAQKHPKEYKPHKKNLTKPSPTYNRSNYPKKLRKKF
jgi:hypothetical protein